MMVMALTWKPRVKTSVTDLPTCKRVLNQRVATWMYRLYRGREQRFWHGFRALNRVNSVIQNFPNFESPNPVAHLFRIKNISSRDSLRARLHICGVSLNT